ncbi:hypothetical protein SAMN05518847_106222 [Paenibacillus sp. OV219]|nr:hypothetical protein SAMN05518847_106222 [Paenibacillus sp. OV219]
MLRIWWMKRCRSFGPSERLTSLLNSGILNFTPSGVFPSSKAIACALQLVHFPHASPSSSPLCFAKASTSATYMLRWQHWMSRNRCSQLCGSTNKGKDKRRQEQPKTRTTKDKDKDPASPQSTSGCVPHRSWGEACENKRTAPTGPVLYCLPFFVSNTMVRIRAYYFWTCLNIDGTSSCAYPHG